MYDFLRFGVCQNVIFVRSPDSPSYWFTAEKSAPAGNQYYKDQCIYQKSDEIKQTELVCESQDYVDDYDNKCKEVEDFSFAQDTDSTDHHGIGVAKHHDGNQPLHDCVFLIGTYNPDNRGDAECQP